MSHLVRRLRLHGDERRLQASSGRVDYIAPIETHNSNRSRIELITFSIPRSGGDDVAIKLVKYDKTKLGGLSPNAEINITLPPADGSSERCVSTKRSPPKEPTETSS